MDVTFLSELPSLMRNQLESVFFFNLKQAIWSKQISQVVEAHGVPEIREANDKITLALRGNADTQTVFGVNSQRPEILEGVIIYGRAHYAEILVLHLALARFQLATAPTPPATGNPVNFLGLITAFTKLAKNIAGVKRLRFAYWNLAIPVV
ncbi:MAG: hypothetical protein WCH99_00045 [Verrucomicrobiota bacterium]